MSLTISAKHNVHMAQSLFKLLSTNKTGVNVQLNFCDSKKEVTASVIDGQGRISVIKREDVPKEFRQIKSSSVFHSYFSEAFATIGYLSNGDCSLRIFQRGKGGVPGADNGDENLPAHTMALMTEGIQQIRGSEVQENIIMFLGRTGAGKSLLMNVLNGVNISGVEDADGRFRFDLEQPITQVSNSHVVSGTQYPVLHTPQGAHDTYVDCPGFGDTHGPYQDIANAFFRAEVTARIVNAKIVLLVAYADVYRRGNHFSDTLHDLMQFLGCCQTEAGIRKAASSVLLVVTKVAPPRSNEQAGLDRQAQEVHGCLERQLGVDGGLSDQAKTFLRQVLAESRWTIFSSPNGEGQCPRAALERDAIADRIRNTPYLKKADADFQVRVPQRYQGQVITSISMLIQGLKKKVATAIIRDLDGVIKQHYEERGEIALKEQLQQLQSLNQDAAYSLTAFLAAIQKEIPLSNETKKEVESHKDAFNFLVNVLPEGTVRTNSEVKRWFVELGLNQELRKRVNSLTQMTTSIAPTFSNGKLTLRSHFPKTSQIKSMLRDTSVVSLQEIEINALHTVTFDEDLKDEKLRGVNLTVIAPKWEIVRHREIVLTGGNANNMFFTRASDGPSAGENGTSGSPGLPGGGGGNFFGLARVISGVDRLTIVSNGGKGGRGQDGGNGHEGQRGVDGVEEIRSPEKGGTWSNIGNKDGNTNQELSNAGTPGKKGGNAGQGGIGGDAGIKGVIEMISLSNQPLTLTTQLQNGVKGEDGNPGEAGVGGVNGKTWKGVWYHRDGEWNTWEAPKYHDAGKAGSGNVPTTTNSTDKVSSIAREKIKIHMRLLGFKEFALESNNAYIAEALETFCRDFEASESIREKAEVQRFIDESIGIEDLYSKVTSKISTLPFYLSLLTRMNNFVNGRSNIPPVDIIRLQHLCGFALSKICQIKAISSPHLVIDIRGFLVEVNRNIDELSSFDRARMVEAYKVEYESQMQERIKEADLFINKLRDDIRAAHRDITAQADVLIAEIRQLRRQGEASRSQLIQKKQQLKEILAKKAILGGLSIAIQCVGCCFPPAGPFVAGIVNAGLQFFAKPSPLGAISQGAFIAANVAQLNVIINAQPLNPQDQQMANLIRTRDVCVTAGNIVQAGQKLQQELEDGEDKIREIETSIRQTDEQIQQLHQYELRVPDLLETPLHQLVESAEILQKELQKSSSIARDYNRLSIKRTFDNAKQQVKKSTEGLASGDGFVTILQQMQEALDTSMNIYDRIQDYEDRVTLAKYMANLANPSSGVQDAGLDALRLKMQFNLVLEQYSRAVAAVRQWAFPFGLYFLGDFANLEQFARSATIGDHINLIKRRMSGLQTRVTNYFTQVQAVIDQGIITTTFSHQFPSTPFYVWRSQEFAREIGAILRGNVAILFADVRRSTLHHAAIKFKEVALHFRCEDRQLQRELDEALLGFKIELHHSGNSYYRYGENVYQISNEGSFNISYSFAQNRENVPMERDRVYDKMKTGDLMLSPYTHWAIRLAPVRGNGNLFERFQERLAEIELHLEGHGQYVDETRTLQLQLDPDYRRSLVNL